MAEAFTSTSAVGGSQGPPMPNYNNLTMNIYMMSMGAHLSTKIRDYKTLKYIEKGKDASNPSNPLQIENTMGETMTHIPKGAFKKASHNPNARVSHNYSFVEDLA